jgi:hypothetical protein
MTTRASLTLSTVVAAGALLLSGTAFAQAQSGQPQGNPPQPSQPQTDSSQPQANSTQPQANSVQPNQPPASQQPQASSPAIVLPGQGPQQQQPEQPGQQARPGSMPQTGLVVLSFSGTTTQAPQSTAVAPNIEMLSVTMHMTSMNAAPESFMNVMSGICSGPAFIHKKANKIEASGFCNYSDIDGNQVFEHFVIPLQSQDNPLQANGV